jgi:hypothetical protein
MSFNPAGLRVWRGFCVWDQAMVLRLSLMSKADVGRTRNRRRVNAGGGHGAECTLERAPTKDQARPP